ncbi:MAG: hypothetical protein MUC42_03765 [Bryobacter sp.]|nr:hypothetical protein [Bryobacter sp.]
MIASVAPSAAQFILGTAAGGGPDNVAAREANLHWPRRIAVDRDGNLIVVSMVQNRVFRIDAGGLLRVAGGNGYRQVTSPAYNHDAEDGGPARNATLSAPFAVAVDSAGNIFVLHYNDNLTCRIRRIDAGTGNISTVARNLTPRPGLINDASGAGANPFQSGLAMDGQNRLYVADTNEQSRTVIRRIDPATGQSVVVAGGGTNPASGALPLEYQLRPVDDLTVDAGGNLLVLHGGLVARIPPTGPVAVLAGAAPADPAFGSGDGGPAAAANLFRATGIAVDAAGIIYIAEAGSGFIRRILLSGTIERYAGGGTCTLPGVGDGGPARSACTAATSLAFGPAGSLYFSDTLPNLVRRIDATGTVSTVAGYFTAFAKTATPGATGQQAAYAAFSGEGVDPLRAAFYRINSVGVDAEGGMLIADGSDGRIRRIDPRTKLVRTVVGGGRNRLSSFQPGETVPATDLDFSGDTGLTFSIDGNSLLVSAPAQGIIFRVRNGQASLLAGTGGSAFTPPGGPATAASLRRPMHAIADSQGNVFFVERGSCLIRRIRAADGILEDWVGRANLCAVSPDPQFRSNATMAEPFGIAIDSRGILYFRDRNGVRGVNANGTTALLIPTARMAEISANADVWGSEGGLMMDAAGTLLTGTPGGWIYRYSVLNGSTSAIAGGPRTDVPTGDGGPSLGATLPPVLSIGAGAGGTLLVGSGFGSNADRVRALIPATEIRLLSNPPGPNLTVNGVNVSTPATVYWEAGRSYTIGAPSPQNSQNTRFVFQSWSQGGAQTQAIVAPAVTTTYTANFVAQGLLTLNVNPAGAGVIETTPTSPDGYFALGTRVALFAKANEGWIFERFTGDITGIQSSGAITIDRNRTVTANFTGQPGPPPPRIPAATSVVNGASFLPGFAPGGFVTIFGENLSLTSREWRASDFVNDQLPTQLDGVSVTIGGRSAYVYFISPTQLNVLAPFAANEEAVDVQVTNANGRSNIVRVDQRRFSPGFFLFAPQNRRYLAAIFPDGSAVGPRGLLGPGASITRPARPGETILLFMTGLGATNPAFPDGRIIRQPYPTANPLTVTVGGRPCRVDFAGLTFAGLYQVNVTLPADLPVGDQLVTAAIGGANSQANAFVAIGN